MTDKETDLKTGISPEWLVRGVLTRLGDNFDRLTGRRWTPSSSLATSELIERLKRMLDSEAKTVEGKGPVVPHNIKLKMQWDKFSEDAEDALSTLQSELLTAAADHINDSLYYTLAPLTVQVKTDYFTEGVKLNLSFDDTSSEDGPGEAEMNVTMPVINIPDPVAAAPAATSASCTYRVRSKINGVGSDKTIELSPGVRLTVGRTGGNDLILDDASVSKIHAALVADDTGQLSVADTGSTNGTFVNGRRISYGKATRLSEAGQVKFGAVEVAFELISSPTPETPDEGVSIDESPEENISERATDKPRGRAIQDETMVLEDNGDPTPN